MALITAGIWPTGVASKTRSASRTACAGSCEASSITLSLNASERLRRVRPTPTTRRTARARLSANANEPPIRPTPMTTSLLIFSLVPMLELLNRQGAKNHEESACSRATRKRVFSDSSPTVTRRCCGMP